MTYIDNKAKVLAHMDRLVDWRRGTRRAPVTVEWDMSNRCSLGCQSCHFAHTHTKGPWAARSERRLPMAFDPCGDLLDVGLAERSIAELERAGVRGIVWSGGGEPTLHPRWEEIIMLAAERGLHQGMYTLGGHFSKESAAFAGDHLDWVVVSLDCADAETYAREKGVAADRFHDACHGIRWLSGHSAVVGVSFLLHGGNYRKSKDMLLLARRLGATYATFRPTIEADIQQPSRCINDRAWIPNALPYLRSLATEDDVEIDVDRFMAYYEWKGHGYDVCHGSQLNATITPDGRVWVCPQRRGSPAGLIGDLRIETFGSLWARHRGGFNVDEGCRVMCRLHPINQQIAQLDQPVLHGAFV